MLCITLSPDSHWVPLNIHSFILDMLDDGLRGPNGLCVSNALEIAMNSTIRFKMFHSSPIERYIFYFFGLE